VFIWHSLEEKKHKMSYQEFPNSVLDNNLPITHETDEMEPRQKVFLGD
jgi:hypothetical protein